MNKVAIAFLTKDRVELTKRSIKPLYRFDACDVYWLDGSKEKATLDFTYQLLSKHNEVYFHSDIFGGPDAAVVYALTMLLDNDYDYIGLVENDVLLPNDWFDRTMALFDVGVKDGLKVGAVSARCYVDRILVQRSGYALVHNHGWGTQIMTREAAQLTLNNLRTGWTLDNRRAFSSLAGVDIGKWWAFRLSEHHITTDWNNEAMLASHGLASIASTPSHVQMIGQDPPLAQQGLTIATEPVEALRNDCAFGLFVERTRQVREGRLCLPDTSYVRNVDGSHIVFAHQLGGLGARWEGNWTLKAFAGFGPFAWRAAEQGASLTVPVVGPCSIYLTGGKDGAAWEIIDTAGIKASPTLPPETTLMWIDLPTPVVYREIRITATKAGGIVYGIKCRDPQIRVADWRFDHGKLPRIE